jgi:hypothetical protein
VAIDVAGAPSGLRYGASNRGHHRELGGLAMQSWIAKRLISYLMERLRAGDVRPILALDAPDVELTFPGDSSWSGVFRGKAEVRRWLERFVASGLQIYADEASQLDGYLAEHRPDLMPAAAAAA